MNSTVAKPSAEKPFSTGFATTAGNHAEVCTENDTFFAHLNVKQESPNGETEQMLRIDARPSDGIAIAVRRHCPIYVADEVMESAAQDESSVERDESGDADSED